MTSTVPLVVDTSAVVAILQSERGSDGLVVHLAGAGPCVMSAASRVEVGIVIEARLGAPGADVVERLLRDAAISVVPVDLDAAERALGAWRRYGKGRHPAALNYGDCFTYALAEVTGFPVLCTGKDFAATDLPVLTGTG